MSTCPSCDFEGCYNSGFTVECINAKCRHYSMDHAKGWLRDHIKDQLKIYVAGGNIEFGLPDGWDITVRSSTSVTICAPTSDPNKVVEYVVNF